MCRLPMPQGDAEEAVQAEPGLPGIPLGVPLKGAARGRSPRELEKAPWGCAQRPLGRWRWGLGVLHEGGRPWETVPALGLRVLISASGRGAFQV